MQVSLTFKNLDPSDHLKAYVENKLNRFDRLLDNPAEASVVLTVEKFRHIAEINLSCDRISITGKEETNDMYSAIDMVLDKLDKQIKKNKQKVRERRSGAKAKLLDTGMESLVGALPLDDGDKEVLVQNIEYKPMDIEEAIMQIDLLTDNFLVFTNARTEQVNVLYRRKDGNYGLIQPSS